MIAQLTGRLIAKSADACVIDVGGVGFRVAMSAKALSRLPETDDTVTILTHLQVREDELSLFGFDDLEEQELFLQLISVSGVGPKLALAVLSALTPATLREALLRGDHALISTVPGIGKKTAQRLIVELKDKVAATGFDTALPALSAASEATDALASMGFSSAEIAAAVKGYDGPDDAQSLLRHALKRLGGKL